MNLKATSPLVNFFIEQEFASGDFFNGKEFTKFSAFEDEFAALKRGVAFRDVSTGLVELTGSDALDFLHRITTNALKDLKLSEARPTLFTNEKGRILDRVTVLRRQDSILLFCSPQSAQRVTHWIERYVIADDVKIENTLGKTATLEVYGAQAESFLVLLFGRNLEFLAHNTSGTFASENRLFTVVKLNPEKEKKSYLITGGLKDIEILLTAAKREQSIFSFAVIGSDSYTHFRLKHAIPGENELSDEFNPHEVGLAEDISFTKGCYIGQEVIARLDTYDKVQKRLVKVSVAEIPQETDVPLPVIDEQGNDAGVLTTLVKENKVATIPNNGLAIIRKRYTETQAKLLIKAGDKNLPLTIVG